MQSALQNIFKKAFNIVKDCPFITLYFVLYLIILFLIIPFMLTGRSLLQAGSLGILLMLLTCAFTAGWFNMIKAALLNYKEEKTAEEKLDEAIKLKNHFFSGVSEYILPIILGSIIFLIFLYAHSYLSDMLFGKIDQVLNDISKFANDPNGLGNYFATLPEATWVMILKKGIFSYILVSLITLLFLFWSASLYLNLSNNPFSAIIDSIKAMFCKFFETIVIFIFLIIVNFILMFLQGLFIENVIISFITMILRIYFAAYLVVLIFALYNNRLYECAEVTSDCNNSSDSSRQDGSGN